MEPFWVVSEMKEELYVGYLNSLFFPIYKKGLIGVCYCNLRNPVKATSHLLRDNKNKAQYKER
jgi:hypothetical protein